MTNTPLTSKIVEQPKKWCSTKNYLLEFLSLSDVRRQWNIENESQESHHSFDEIDGPTVLSLSLKKRILEDAVFFLSLSTDDLQKIIDLGLETLSAELNSSAQRIRLILDSCEQELSRRTDIKQTRELLSICQKAMDNVKTQNDVGDQESKKIKIQDCKT